MELFPAGYVKLVQEAVEREALDPLTFVDKGTAKMLRREGVTKIRAMLPQDLELITHSRGKERTSKNARGLNLLA